MQTLAIYFTVVFVAVLILADILRKVTSRWVDIEENELQDPLARQLVDHKQENFSVWYEKLFITLITSFAIYFVLIFISLPFFLLFQILTWIRYSELHFASVDMMIMTSFSVVIGFIFSSLCIFLPFKVLLQAFLYELYVWFLFPLSITIDWLIIHSILLFSPGVEVTSWWVSFFMALLTNLCNYFFNRTDSDGVQ